MELEFFDHNLIKHITRIMNQYLTTSRYPCQWKKSLVTPLPTHFSPKGYHNLRPLPYYRQCLEFLRKPLKHICDNTFSHINILPQWQSGFWKYHSCTRWLFEGFWCAKSRLAICHFAFHRTFFYKPWAGNSERQRG